MAIVGIIQFRISCRGYLRDGFILFAGQYFNFGLVSAVKDVLKLLSKIIGWLILIDTPIEGKRAKLTSILEVDVRFVEAMLKPIIKFELFLIDALYCKIPFFHRVL